MILSASNNGPSNLLNYCLYLRSCCWACLIYFALSRIFMATDITVFAKTYLSINYIFFVRVHHQDYHFFRFLSIFFNTILFSEYLNYYCSGLAVAPFNNFFMLLLVDGYEFFCSLFFYFFHYIKVFLLMLSTSAKIMQHFR